MNINQYTSADLKIMQEWDLERKIQVTQTRIMEWYIKHNNKCFVSFSGGKDSTVLADLVARVCTTLGGSLTLWFSDTGLEYPELREHVKSFPKYLEEKYGIEVKLVIDYPKDKKGKRITFRNVILNEGYPIISKQVSNTVKGARLGQKSRLDKLNGISKMKDGNLSLFNCKKYKYLLDAPFKISDVCCDIMKKCPSHEFAKKTGLFPIIGTMACESQLRKKEWLKNGCNAFNKKNASSQPMSFWTEQDVLKYIKQYSIPYPTVYGDIIEDENGKLKTTGCNRTGCVFCGFGCHLEKEPNRFQKLKQTHPKLWDYCMKSVDEGGLGMKEVLKYIGVKYE